MERYKSVKDFIEKQERWKDEVVELRNIICETEMFEAFKWNFPVYTVNGKNVVGIGSFKDYFGIWFFQGVFLKDRAKKLVNAQDGKTKAMRQWRFTSLDEMDKELILQYLEEAIENQKKGKELKPEKKPLVIPEELKEELASDGTLAEAFEDLTLSCRREYADYISAAKRDATKQKRLEKIKPMILDKVGLNDKYK